MSDGILDTEHVVDEKAVDDGKEPVGQRVTEALKEQQDDVANKEFLASLPEALRDIPQMKSIKGTADLATQFVNQQSLLGNSLRIPTKDTSTEQKDEFYKKITEVDGVIRLPGEDADDSQMGEFYTKLGVPGTPNEYNIKLPEGKTLDQEFLRVASEKAHALKLNNKQFNMVLHEEIAIREASEMAGQEYIDRSRTSLKAIWSNDYETRVSGATNAFRVYKQEMPEYAEELEQFKNNPIFIKVLSDMAEVMQERGHAGMQTSSNYGMSVEDAKMKQQEIMSNPNHPYFNGDQDAINYMLKLNEIIVSATV